jgi:hypothetical protein
MSTFNFFLPGNFQITQNAELYIMNENNLGTREFHLRINAGSSLNQLFNSRTYKQNSTNAENIDINLIINDTYVTSLFSNVLNTTGGTFGNFIGMSDTAVSFSQRLLEIAALKIFGHAKARAAIANDNDFTNLHTQATTHLTTSFTNSEIKNTFFEQYYLAQGIADAPAANDVDEFVNFNLAASQLFIYGTLSGSIADGTAGTPGTYPGNSYNATMRIELTGY